MLTRLLLAGALLSAAGPLAQAAGGLGNHPALAQAPSWPAGSETVPFENMEGVVVIDATLHGIGDRDTTGHLVLDTGAGFLALDPEVATALGLSDHPPPRNEVEVTDHPLARLEIGDLQIDQLRPVLTLDVNIVKRVIDRPVLGLLGQKPLGNRIVWIDYVARQVTLIPVADHVPPAAPAARGAARSALVDSASAALSRAALGGHLSDHAAPVPFRLAGDGKIVLLARVSDPFAPSYSDSLTMLLDTGATKCVFFAGAFEQRAPGAAQWPSLRGLAAPTLVGVSDARLVRIPSLKIAGLERPLEGIDAAVLKTELSGVLSRAVGETVDGLLGYSFLKRFRLAIDYPHRLVWLDPLPRSVWDDRPYEYSQVGLQIERVGPDARVVAVASPSPADSAGIVRGDRVVSIDKHQAADVGVVELTRLLEGPPGTSVTLVLLREGIEKTYRLVRRRLL